MERRQVPLYAAIERTPRSVLVGENTDTGTVADLVSAVVEIDHSGAYLDQSGMRQNHSFGDSGIDLDVIRQVSGIGEASSEAAAIDSVDTETKALPAVNRACRRRKGLI